MSLGNHDMKALQPPVVSIIIGKKSTATIPFMLYVIFPPV
jgi:hypothetical protein